MAQVAFLVSSLIGLLLIGVIVALIGRGGKHYALPERIAPREGRSSIGRATRSPAVWTLVFVVTVIVLAGAAVLFVGGTGIPEGVKPVAGVILAVGTAVLLLGYVFYGTFASARSRGLADAQAAALGTWALGLLFITTIALKLLGVF